MKTNRIILSLIWISLANLPIFSQSSFRWPDRGIKVFSVDSMYSLNLRFRMQNRALYTSVSEDDFTAKDIEARVRRLRLTLDGHVYTRKLTYKIQLSFSRGDMDWNGTDNSSINNSPNVVRDAVLNYQFTKNLQVSFGQTKLPGNRQRVVSSGAQQFVDRTVVNATFNIDRDFGAFFNYRNRIIGLDYVLKGAITSGEGRNSNLSRGGGLAYTGRIELLPLGHFTNGGDYFEGDLEREPTPKLSICATVSHNDGAQRLAGQLGNDLYQSRNMEYYEADLLFKYRGLALSAEYMKRMTNDPFTVNATGAKRVIYEGEGAMSQLSYIFKNNVEIAGRYAFVTPSDRVQFVHPATSNYTLGVTKYLAHHRLKIQSNLIYQTTIQKVDAAPQNKSNNWQLAFQVELGI
jgi:hypothetical protein